MKKLFVLAISAILVANISAQEQEKECKGKKINKEERVEFDIKRLSHELYLSDKQAKNFAVTYREYAAELDKLFDKKECPFKDGQEISDAELEKAAKVRFAKQRQLIDLQEKFYDKFRKDLNPRQVDQVLRLPEPREPKHECCGKHEGEPKPKGLKHKEEPKFEKKRH